MAPQGLPGEFLEPRQLPGAADQPQAVGLGRNGDAGGQIVAAVHAVVYALPGDVVAITPVLATAVAQGVHPVTDFHEALGYVFRRRALQPEFPREEWLSGQVSCQPVAFVPEALELLANGVRFGPWHR